MLVTGPGRRPETGTEEEATEAGAWLATGRETWRASWLIRLSIDYGVERKSWRKDWKGELSEGRGRRRVLSRDGLTVSARHHHADCAIFALHFDLFFTSV